MSGQLITSADAIITVVVDTLYPSGFQLEGFATDDIFTGGDLTIADTMMGADGYLSAGFVPKHVDMTIALQSDSSSRSKFDTWASTSVTAKMVYRASMTVILPSYGKQYTLSNGVLISWKVMADGKSLLQPTNAVLRFQGITPSDYSS